MRRGKLVFSVELVRRLLELPSDAYFRGISYDADKHAVQFHLSNTGSETPECAPDPIISYGPVDESPNDLVDTILSKQNKLKGQMYNPRYLVIWEGYIPALYDYEYSPIMIGSIEKFCGLQIIKTTVPEVVEVY